MNTWLFRLGLYKKFLKTLEDDSICMFVDGYDVIFNSSKLVITISPLLSTADKSLIASITPANLATVLLAVSLKSKV